jgi:hypothetical protein
MTPGRTFATIIGFAAFAGCCQSTSAQAASPAVLAQADEATMARIKAALAKEMGRSPVELGPGDLTQSSTISVLPLPPGPLEDRSLARPTIFRLEIEGGACVLVREGEAGVSGARIPLDGVECRAAQK